MHKRTFLFSFFFFFTVFAILNKVIVKSWNSGGLNNPVKLSRIQNHLTNLKTEIALLQETHLMPSEAIQLKQKWVGQIFYSIHIMAESNKSRGCCSNTQKPFVMQNSEQWYRRHVLLDCLLYNVPVVTVNVYGPNVNPLFSHCNTVLSQYEGRPVIMGGHFNAVPNPSLEREASSISWVYFYSTGSHVQECGAVGCLEGDESRN